jgi:hypothetical protein
MPKPKVDRFDEVLADWKTLLPQMRDRRPGSSPMCHSITALIKTDLGSNDLESCMTRFVKSVRLQAVREGGAVAYAYDVTFVDGSRPSDQ